METKRLEQFKTVVEAGGLLKASELLGISGGGLSKSLKNLEQELGHKLFFQRGRQLELTDLGRKFYDKLPDVLNAINNLVQLNLRSEARPTLRFATFEVFSTYFLTSFIAEELAKDTVEVREVVPGEMEKTVYNGDADIGITYEPIPHRGVIFLNVTSIKMGLYSSQRPVFSNGSFSDIPFVVPITPINGAPSGVKGLDGWPDHLLERKIQFKAEMMQTALLLCSKGVAAAFLPDFVVNFYNEQILAKEKLVPLPSPRGLKTVKRDVFIILRKDEPEDRIVKKLARALRRLG